MPTKRNHNKKTKVWITVASVILVAVAVTTLALTNRQTAPDTQSYVGLLITDARQRAEAGSRSYHVYDISQRSMAQKDQRYGLILYTENGRVALAEVHVEPRARVYIGLTEAEAIQKAQDEGREYRVVIRDGEHQGITDDLRPERVNFYISDGEVVDAHFN